MNHFQSLRSYEDFIYDLPILFPVVVYSTLVAVRISAKQVRVAGEVVFSDAYRMVVRERIDIADDHLLIRHYGYEAWRGKEKLYWYDSQAHPNDSTLALSHPHHKHVPPDIKHNRIPAPELSFTHPNLPFLINEIAQLISTDSSLSA
ncbi:MAG: DUF6516 family protein [Caldilineaceae bacterium]